MSSMDTAEKEDEIFNLTKEVAEKVKSTAESRYKLSIARAELKVLKSEDKKDKE